MVELVTLSSAGGNNILGFYCGDVVNMRSSRSLLDRGLSGLRLGAEMGRNALHPRTSRSVAFAVSLETITALPLAAGLSRIQVETRAFSCASEKGARGRNGGERLQMALKSAGLKVLITTD